MYATTKCKCSHCEEVSNTVTLSREVESIQPLNYFNLPNRAKIMSDTNSENLVKKYEKIYPSLPMQWISSTERNDSSMYDMGIKSWHAFGGSLTDLLDVHLAEVLTGISNGLWQYGGKYYSYQLMKRLSEILHEKDKNVLKRHFDILITGVIPDDR